MLGEGKRPAMPARYTVIDSGRSVSGVRWEIGVLDDGLLVVNVASHLAILEGAQRGRFTEAVARAETPGQAEAAQSAGTEGAP